MYCLRLSRRAHTILCYWKGSQRSFQSSHKTIRIIERKFIILRSFLFAMHRKLMHLLPDRKSGIMHENLHSNVVFHILLIVDYKLESRYTPKDPTNICLSIFHYMGSNRALNTIENLKNYSIQLAASIRIYKTRPHLQGQHYYQCHWAPQRPPLAQGSETTNITM